MIIFTLFVWWHTYYGDVAFKVGGYNSYSQCEQQGRGFQSATTGYSNGIYYKCVPVNHY